MVDTVTFWTEDGQAREWKDRLPQSQVVRRGADRYEGNAGNMRILETLDGVTVSGSVAKYLNGENMTVLTRESYARALQKLQEETGLDLHKAVLRRVDFGASIITKGPPAEYLRLFDLLPRYKQRVENGCTGIESVLYHTRKGGLQFCAYDKIKEAVDGGGVVPELYRDCNVLRMEYRIINRQSVKAKLGDGADVSPWRLAENDTYRNLGKFFWEFYDSIPKTGRRVFLDGEKEYTPKELTDIQAEAYRQNAPQEYRAILQTLSERGRLTAKSLERIKAQERKNGQNYVFSDTNVLITELDEKTHCRAFTGA